MPFALRGRDLVPNPFPRDLPLELGEGEQNVQGQPPHGTGGVELLGDGNEGDAPGIQGLDDLGEVGQAAGQPIHLIYNDGVDLVGFDVREQLLEGRAVEIST